MFRKRDLEFQECLDDPAKLEKRLKQLANTRLVAASSAVLAAIAYFVVLFIDLQTFKTQGGGFPGTVLMLAITVLPTIKAVLAHGEIRTLLIFNKLRDSSEKE